MLQALLQLRLLGRRKLAELCVAFERAALLVRRKVFVAAQPVSGVAGLVRSGRSIDRRGKLFALLLEFALTLRLQLALFFLLLT